MKSKAKEMGTFTLGMAICFAVCFGGYWFGNERYGFQKSRIEADVLRNYH